MLHDIPGYPNYKLSSELDVWSCKSKQFLSNANSKGYVSLYNENGRKVFTKKMFYRILNPISLEGFCKVDGYDGYYVSGDGKVYSEKQGVFLDQCLDSYGYCVVTLYSGSRNSRTTKKVHQLVAKAFLPNPNMYETVDHLNNDKTDNRVENLEWCTHSENTRRQWARKRVA